MAKVGFWLQGSKGKLSGASLSTGKNGSIIRTIVKPKNPRTDKQMSQRAIFATIAKAASVMKPIINHSFEGIEDGDACIKEFRKLNLTKLRNVVANDIAQNKGIDELTAYVAPKGYPYITPNSYIVSKGSLTAPTLVLIQDGQTLGFDDYDVTIEGEDVSVRQAVQYGLGLNPGEQLTLAYINVQARSQLYYSAGNEPGQSCYDNVFGSKRIVFKPYEGNEEDWEKTILNQGEVVLANIEAVVDFSKTDAKLFEVIFGSLDATVNTGSVTITINANAFGDPNTKAGALIRSQQKADGSWMYSNAVMLLINPDLSHNYGLPLAEAVKTYTAGVSVGKDNSPFLDEGQNGGTLSMSSFE